jgi:hypothetical protein
MIQRAASVVEPDPAGAGLEPAGDGQMWWDRYYQPQLRQAGLDGFDEVMANSGGRCLRELKIRENWYLPVEGDPANAHGLYLKKHRARTWLSRLRAWLRIGPGETPASDCGD